MYDPLRYINSDLKHKGTDISGLNEVRIKNAKGELIRTVHAKRIEEGGYQFPQVKRANRRKKLERQKKLKPSDLIEI